MRYLTYTLLTLLALAGGLAYFFIGPGLPKAEVDARYSSPASQFLELGDQGRIHFRDEGKRDGLPLLLVHGSTASLHTYEPWVQRLAGEYRLISLDLPGHGLTGETPAGDYSADAYVAVMEALRAYLSLGKFVLVGHSMGGHVALSYARAYPDNLLALALVASSGLELQAEDERQPPFIFTLLQEPWFQDVAAYLDMGLLLDQGLSAAYSDSSVLTDALKRRYYELNMREGTRAATVKRIQQGRQLLPESAIAAIRVPVLVMWGEKDVLTPFAMAVRFTELLPAVQTAFYKQVGHMPMEEIPNLSARDLRAFLARLPRP